MIITIEQHLHKVLQHLVNRTTTELQQLFRRLCEEWRGDFWWDNDTGRDLWWDCCTQLKTTRKELIVTGQIDKWNVQELTALFSAVTQVMLPFLLIDEVILKEKTVESLRKIVSLFETLDMTKYQVSEAEYDSFIFKLKEVLTELDTYGINLSNITNEAISVRELKRVVDDLNSMMKEFDKHQRVNLSALIQQCTDLLNTSNLPFHLQEMLYKCRLLFCVEAKDADPLLFNLESDCINILKHDRPHIQSHYQLSKIYSSPGGKNINQHFYHYINVSQPNAYPREILRFIFALHPFHPRNPSFIELFKGYQILRNEDPSSIFYSVAMKHLNLAFKLGNPYAKYVQSIALIMQCEQKGVYNALAEGLKEMKIREAVKIIHHEVSKKPHYFKFNNEYSQIISDQRGHAHFLLGYMYETGLLVDQNYEQAKKFYRTACTMYNNVLAGYHLGLMYYDGAGVTKNPHWAQWFWKQSLMAPCDGTTYAITMFYIKHLEINKAHVQAEAINCGREMISYEQMKWLLERLSLFFTCDLPRRLADLDEKLQSQWELPFGLSVKGLTLLERLKRAELLGFVHDGYLLLSIYAFFNIPYHQNEICDPLSLPVKQEYILGMDKSLEVEYSQLFSRLYLVSPLRIFTMTTFRNQMNAEFTYKNFKITYRTKDYASLMSEFPTISMDMDPIDWRNSFVGMLTVIEDLL